MQSVLITTDVVGSNLDLGEVYVFSDTSNNISVISVEETGVTVENHRPVASH
jgi:hypothetical protein